MGKKETKTVKEVKQPKEHKRPWQEVYATPEDIKRFLSDHVMLRHNVVRGRTEILRHTPYTGRTAAAAPRWQW